ncbi:FLOT1 protein, partial [Ramphastos sulfuratus]|nr:FLOT1 protein [Ramphastos sulfuratus]
QEIYKDRQKFSEQVFKVASSDLVNMGISVVSYTLKDIKDDQVAPGGAPRGHLRGHRVGTRVWRSSAEAWRAPKMMPPHCHLHCPFSTHPDATLMPPQCHSHLLSSPQHPQNPFLSSCPSLALARTKQQIEEEKAQVLVVERTQQVALQEQEIGRREKELEATVRKPAEAERYRLERLAEAQR